jgi:hypothetical protein
MPKNLSLSFQKYGVGIRDPDPQHSMSSPTFWSGTPTTASLSGSTQVSSKDRDRQCCGSDSLFKPRSGSTNASISWTGEEIFFSQNIMNYRTFYPKICHYAFKNMGLGTGIGIRNTAWVRQPAGLGRQQQQVSVARHRSVEKIEIGSVCGSGSFFKSRSGSTRQFFMTGL